MATTVDQWFGEDGDGEVELPVDLDSNAPYILAAHPDRWTVDVEGRRVLPDLIQIALQRGSSHLEHIGEMARLREQYERERWTLILPAVYAQYTGKQGDRYLKDVPGRDGPVHVAVWSQTFPGSSVIVPDLEASRKFHAWLVESGTIPAPQPHVLRAMQVQAKRNINRYAPDEDRNPASKDKADYWREVVKVLDEVLNPKPVEDKAPAPAPAKKTPAAAKPKADS